MLFDVAIIGGGITGASAANHLAAAGFSTVLLEQSDFASGSVPARAAACRQGWRPAFCPTRSDRWPLRPEMAKRRETRRHLGRPLR
ncbi:FAD-dependent oxidoreductase [Mesorhizobium sp.]|uniref:FAD-dependent oxidoreductase n=1 Tax=Mesorhizobium sp. TaxID=1871066 RepID=UPI001204D429|nr:MAG: FAD-dependent oxidoreductase [Mesorhizobium sp.]